MKICEQNDVPTTVRKMAIQCIGNLCRHLNFMDFASRIIHPLCRVLDDPSVSFPSTSKQLPQDKNLREDIMDTFCVLAYFMGPHFTAFAPTIAKIMTKQQVTHERYEALVIKVLKNQPLSSSDLPAPPPLQALSRAYQSEVKEKSGSLASLSSSSSGGSASASSASGTSGDESDDLLMDSGSTSSASTSSAGSASRCVV